MKGKIVIIIFFLGCGMLQSCSNDDDEINPEFSIDLIHQTAWEGELITDYSDESQNTDKFSILFTTDSRGNYEVISTEENKDFRGYFNYSVDGKLITVTRDNHSFLQGDWMVTKVEENELELKRFLNSTKFRKTLKLTRIY